MKKPQFNYSSRLLSRQTGTREKKKKQAMLNKI